MDECHDWESETWRSFVSSLLVGGGFKKLGGLVVSSGDILMSDQTEQVRGRLSVAGPLLNGEGSPDEDGASYKSLLTQSLALWAEGTR